MADLDVSYDVVVLTALRLEADAMVTALGPDVTTPLWRGSRVAVSTAGHLRVLVLPIDAMTNVPAAQVAQLAISQWSPDWLLLVGIAAGIGDVHLGDVLVADQVVGYEHAKVTPDGHQIRFDVNKPDPELVSIALGLPQRAWTDRIAVAAPETDVRSPVAHIGPLLSGDKVHAGGATVQQLRAHWPKAIGVEMEAHGVATSAYRNRTGFLVVKAVCDFAGPDKDDTWQAHAASAAAAFTVALLAAVAPRRRPAATPRVWTVGAKPDRRRLVTHEAPVPLLDYLAAETLSYWTQQAIERGITAPVPATVRYELVGSEPRVPVESLTKEVVTTLYHDIYRPVADAGGTVVIVGGAGAGKTTAMLLLLLETLRSRHDGDGTPVPVWLTLGDWDPIRPLHHWAADRLIHDFPELATLPDKGNPDVRQLFRHRRLALYLDGLDEMPPDLQGKALDRINVEAGGLPVVLTCRPDEYRAAMTGRRSTAAVIELLPPTLDDIKAFLRAGQPDRRMPDSWRRVVDAVEAEPSGPVATALDTPFALALARDVFHGGQPTDLLNPDRFGTREEILKELMGGFMTAAYRDDEEQHTQAVQWFAWMAASMSDRRDLQWWNIPSWFPQRHLVSTAAAVLLLPFCLLAGLPAVIGFGAAIGIPLGIVCGAAAASVAGWECVEPDPTLAPDQGPIGWTLRRPRLAMLTTKARLARLGAAVGGGLAFGALLVGGILIRTGHVEWAYLLVGLGFGVVFAIATIVEFGTWRDPMATSGVATPTDIYRRDRRRFVGKMALAWSVAIGGEVAIVTMYRMIFDAVGLDSDLTHAIVYGLATVGGAVVALVGLSTGVGPAAMIELAGLSVVLRSWGQERTRFLPLLESGLHRNVLRQAGVRYQFRHATLQDYLAADPLPAPPDLRFQPPVAAGRGEGEEQRLRQAIDDGSADAATYEALGDVLRRQGRLDEAVDAFWSAIEHGATSRYHLTTALNDRMAVTRSGMSHRAVARHARDLARDYRTIGNLEFADGDVGAAMTAYDKAARLDPGDAVTHQCLAEAFIAQNRPDKAEAAYRAALAIDPKDATVHRGLADALTMQGRVEDAADLYAKAIELTPDRNRRDHPEYEPPPRHGREAESRLPYHNHTQPPNHVDAMLVHGDLAWRAGRPDEAFGHYVAALGAVAVASRTEGELYLRIGRWERAAETFTAVLERDPTDASAHRGLGEALVELGDPVGAEHSFLQAIAMAPDDGPAHRGLGSALIEQGRAAQAAHAYRRAVELMPDDGRAHRGLGDAQAEQGLADRAEVAYRHAVERTPGDVFAHLGRAEALVDLGRDEEAENAYRAAIDLDYSDGLLHYDLGDILARQGQAEEAAAQYRLGRLVRGGWLGPYWESHELYNGRRKLLRNEECAARQNLERDPAEIEARHRLDQIRSERGRPGQHRTD